VVAIATDLEPEEFPLPAATTPPVPATTVAHANKASGVVSVPTVLKYSEDAQKARLRGAVVIRCVVGVDGLPHDLQVVSSHGLGLDEQALAAVAVWRFAPAKKDGKAVESAVTVALIFRMLGDNGGPLLWHLGRAEIKTVAGAPPPTV
jgi:TonB family protein